MEDCVRTSRGTVLLSEAARRNQKLLDSFKIGNDTCLPKTEFSGQYYRPRSSEVANRRRKATRPASLYDFRTQYNVDSWEAAKTAEFHELVPNKNSGRYEFLESRTACFKQVGRCNEAKETNKGHAKENSYVVNAPCSHSTIVKSSVEQSTFEPSSRSDSRYRNSSAIGKSTTATSMFEKVTEKGHEVHREPRKIANPCSLSTLVKSRTVKQSERVEQSEVEPDMGSENFDGISTEQMDQKSIEPENGLQASQYLDLGNRALVCKVDESYSYTWGRGKYADECKKLKIERRRTSEDEWSTVESATGEENRKLEMRRESEGEFINDLLIGLRTTNAGQSFQNSKKSEAKNGECEGNSKNIACCDEAKSTRNRDKNLSLLIGGCYDVRSELNDVNNDCIRSLEQQLKGSGCEDRGHNGKKGTACKKNHEEGTCLCLKQSNGLEKEKLDMVLQEGRNVDGAVILCSLNEIKSIMQEKDDNIKTLKMEEATGIGDMSCIKQNYTDKTKHDAKMAPTHYENCPIYVVMNQTKRNVFCTTSKNITLSPLLGSQSKELQIYDPSDACADSSIEKKDRRNLETNATDINKVILSKLKNSKECIVQRGLHVAKLKTAKALDEILSKIPSILACTKDSSYEYVAIIILNVDDSEELERTGKNGSVDEEEINAVLKDIGNTTLHSVDFRACAKALNFPEETKVAEYPVLDSKETARKKISRSFVGVKSQISTERNILRHEFIDQLPSVQERSASDVASASNANQNKAPVAEQESFFVIAKPKSSIDANRAVKGASGILTPSVSGDEDEESSEKEVKPMSDGRISLGERSSSVLCKYYEHIYERDSNNDLPFGGKCDSEEVTKKNSVSQSAKIAPENNNIDDKDYERCKDTECSSVTKKAEQAIKIRSTDRENEKQDVLCSFDARFARLCWKIERYSLSSLKREAEGRESPFSIYPSFDPSNSARKGRKQCLLSEKRSKSLSLSKVSDYPIPLNTEPEYSAKYRMARNSDVMPNDDENIHVKENLLFNDERDVRCKKKNAGEGFNRSQKKCFEIYKGNLADEKREKSTKTVVEGLTENSNDNYSTCKDERRISNIKRNAKNKIGKEEWQEKILGEGTTKINDAELFGEYERRLKKLKHFEMLFEDSRGAGDNLDTMHRTEDENMRDAAYSIYDIEGEVEECERNDNYSSTSSDNRYEKDERRNSLANKDERRNSLANNRGVKHSKVVEFDGGESDADCKQRSKVLTEAAGRAKERRSTYVFSSKPSNDDRKETAYDGKLSNSRRRHSRRSKYSSADEVNDESEGSKRTSHSDKKKGAKCNDHEEAHVEGSSRFHGRLLSRSMCFDMDSGNEEKEKSKELTYVAKYENTENEDDDFYSEKSPKESRKLFRRSNYDEINAKNESKQHASKGGYQDDIRNGKRNKPDYIKDARSNENYNKQCSCLTPCGKCSMPSVKKGKETSIAENQNALDCRIESNCCMELNETKRRHLGRSKVKERRIEDDQKVATAFHLSKKAILDDQCMSEERNGSSNEKRSLYMRYKRSKIFEQFLEDSMVRDFEEDSICNVEKDTKSSALELESCVEKKEGCAPLHNNSLEIDGVNFENNIRYQGEKTEAVKHDEALDRKKFEASSTKDEEACHSKEVASLVYHETCTRNAERRKVERERNTRDNQAVMAIELGLNVGEGKGKASVKSKRTSKHWKTNADYSDERFEVDISNETHYEDVERKDTLSRDVDNTEGVCVRRQRRSGCFLVGAGNDQKTSSKDFIEENQSIEGVEGVPFGSKNIKEGFLVPNRESCNLDKSSESGEEKLEKEAFTVDLKEPIGKSDYKRCRSEERTYERRYASNFSKKEESNEGLRCGTHELSVIRVDKRQEINSTSVENTECNLNAKENNDLHGMQIVGLQLNKEIVKSDFNTTELGNELGNVCNERKKLTDFDLIDNGCLPAPKITDTFENMQEDAGKCKQKHEREILVDSNARDPNISTLRVNEDTMDVNTEMADKELEPFGKEDGYNGYYINNAEDLMDGSVRRGDAMLKNYKLKSNDIAEDVNQIQIDHGVDFNSYESKMRKIKQKMQQLVHRNTEMEERIVCGAREADMCNDRQWKYFLRKQKLLQLAVTKLWQKEGFDSSRLIQDQENTVYMTEYDLHRKR